MAKQGNNFSACSNSINYTAGVTTSFTWSAPQAITYGTALSATQLDAVLPPAGAAGNGTVTYSPPLGTVLNAGNNQTLNVSFTPNPGSPYLAASKSVPLTVNRAASTSGTRAASNTSTTLAPRTWSLAPLTPLV
jgi:hypothetical protein